MSVDGIIEQKVYSLAELKEMLFPVFKDYKIRRAVLFGSYSKGVAKPDSDVDIPCG